MRWLVIWVAWLGCKGGSDAPASGSAGSAMPAMPTMPASEVKRGQDACAAYVAKVCACADTVPAMKQDCALARALPDALEVGLDVAHSADSTRKDVVQVHDSVRKIVKQCIEGIARLPAAGCP